MGVSVGVFVGVGVSVGVAVGVSVGVAVGVSVGVAVAVPQVQDTVVMFPPLSEKVKVPPGQSLAGSVAITCCGWFGSRVPLDWLKVTPVELLDADQPRSPCESGGRARVTVHV